MTNNPSPRPCPVRQSLQRPQDVDLSVAAQLRALREHADKNGYVVVREFVDEAESGRVADRPQFQEMLTTPRAPKPRSGRSWSGSSPGSPASASTPSPSSPCSVAGESGSSRSPSRPTTPPPADSWKASSRPSTSSILRILPRTSPGDAGGRVQGFLDVQRGSPWATTG